MKTITSSNYNYIFNHESGLFMRWGSSINENPQYSPIGPEILDIEVSTICHGINGPCKHCYKSNTPKGENMSFDMFRSIFNKIPKTLTQIAFGIGDLNANPDLTRMMEYCLHNEHNPGVVPNITIHGGDLTDDWCKTLSTLCGGVAVSVYKPKDIAYNAVKRLKNAGVQQVNLHVLVSEETYEDCLQIIHDVRTDERLKNLTAIVFLTLKPKGKRNNYHNVMNTEKFKKIIDYAQLNKITIGFDSCSAPLFLNAVKNTEHFKLFSSLSESCESDLFSAYINVKGDYWHCSFTEEHHKWNAISVINCENFLKDVWYHEDVKKFRQLLLEQEGYLVKDCRLCPIYDLYPSNITTKSKKYVKIHQV